MYSLDPLTFIDHHYFGRLFSLGYTFSRLLFVLFMLSGSCHRIWHQKLEISLPRAVDTVHHPTEGNLTHLSDSRGSEVTKT